MILRNKKWTCIQIEKYLKDELKNAKESLDNQMSSIL